MTEQRNPSMTTEIAVIGKAVQGQHSGEMSLLADPDLAPIRRQHISLAASCKWSVISQK
jgi:hypothetical protein